VPFISDEDLKAALDKAGVSDAATEAIVEENETARLDGLRASISLLALFSLVAMFFSRRLPDQQPAAAEEVAAPVASSA